MRLPYLLIYLVCAYLFTDVEAQELPDIKAKSEVKSVEELLLNIDDRLKILEEKLEEEADLKLTSFQLGLSFGFNFFTNYNSNKSLSIARHPSVALHFFWPELERQIKITGFAEKTAEEVSDRYFNSRPYLSQLAALISNQSEKIPSRKYLQTLFDAEKEKWANKKIIRPENWGGYLVKPRQFEFWQGRENRLHDRFLFEKSGDDWVISRLAP